MDLIGSLSFFEWIGLAGSLVLFLGPGYALISFYPDRLGLDKTQKVILAVALSIAFWPILLAWLHLLGITLTRFKSLLILSLGWIIGLIRTQCIVPPIARSNCGKHDISRISLWIIFILSTFIRFWAIRDTPFSLGSDSYHHTLIAHMMIGQGALPNDYLPLAPLVTFSYHFGFHGLVASVSWLTDFKVIMLVPILAQILSAVAALSVAFFTEVTTGSRRAAMASAGFTGLISVFPAFFINWGRYTQLTGLVILPVFLGLVWHWIESGYRWSLIPFIGVLAAGIVLAHYRVTLMAAVAVIVLIALTKLFGRITWASWWIILRHIITAAAMAGIIVVPWIWHIMLSFSKGYPNDIGVPSKHFFQLSRLGTGVLDYPTNNVFIGLIVIALILGLWRREPLMIFLLAWTTMMLILSTTQLASVFMDTISVIISLYFPASVVVGWLIVVFVDWLHTYWKSTHWLVWISLLCLFVWGGITGSLIVQPSLAYVREDDLSAMEWIRSGTTDSAYFAVNTFNWKYLPNYVVGSDAGYWIPLLTRRRTVTLPMTYPRERSSKPDLIDSLVSLHQLQGHLASPEALAFLRREGITHVYIGQRGGPIVVEELLKSPAFDLQYQRGSVYVFQFN